MMLPKYFFTGLLLAGFFLNGKSQTITVDNVQGDETVRLHQLMGNKDDRSFTIKPLNINSAQDDSMAGNVKSSAAAFSFLKVKGLIKALPLDWVQEYNSDHPYGWNDGAMIPARGYQTLLSTGFYFRWGILSVQLKPEFVYAVNNNFQAFSTAHSDLTWSQYAGNVLNWIDEPEQFGTGPYKKGYPGQSNIKLRAGKFSIGVSTENIWWGPGIRNSMMLSNAAPGFPHFSLQTNGPLHTFLGTIEMQLIGGKLVHSGIFPPDTNRLYLGQRIYQPKPDDWRYFSGVTLSWQPKWIPGLYLGIIRNVYEYSSEMNSSAGFLKYFPVFQTIFVSGGYSAIDNQDQLGSLYFRYVFPKNHFECYAEYARNDHSQNIRDLVTEPEHSRAFMVGAQKLISLRQPKHFLGFMTEMTHMQLPLDYLMRADPTFYIHTIVVDGYTNYGQMMGAGIGPGSNLLTADFFLLSNTHKIGLMFEKYDHNMDFYQEAFSAAVTKPWTDFSLTAHGNLTAGHFQMNGELAVIYSQNYEWWKTSATSFIPGYKDVTQVHAKLSLRYFW